MIKINKHIEIIRSTTSGLSSLSDASCQDLHALLKRHYAVVGISIVNNLSDLKQLVAKQPDLVFMGMKFLPSSLPEHKGQGQKIWISTYLGANGIAHTGSAKKAVELEESKPLAKQCILDAGLKTAPFIVVKSGEPFAGPSLPIEFPVFVKPTSLGGGQGIDDNSVVHNLADLCAKTQALSDEHSADSLVEAYLPGREFSVAVLKDMYSEELMIMPIELIAPGNEQGDRFLSQQVKSLDQETFHPVTDVAIKARVSNMAFDVFNALGARDYGRIDIRLDEAGIPHFLEANLIPSLLKDYGNFPKACAINMGMDYETVILHIVSLGLAHREMPEMPRQFEPALVLA